MVGVILCTLLRYMGFMGILFCLFVCCCFFFVSWMFQLDYLDTYCSECLICMCFAFLYLHLFSAIEQVSHGKAL